MIDPTTEPDTPPQRLAAMRAEYSSQPLHREQLHAQPMVQFERWMNEAIAAGVLEPNAMTLATTTRDGRPLVRTVLLKGFDQRGFVFFTNLDSRKARHIAENPNVSLLFPWLALERQVVVTGTAEKLTLTEAAGYFLTRPRESRIAAWASQQSAVIASRKVLEMEWQRLKSKFAAREVPLPSFWGGYLVRPETVEFWQGGAHRLHDRFQYTRRDDSSWLIDRLAP